MVVMMTAAPSRGGQTFRLGRRAGLNPRALSQMASAAMGIAQTMTYQHERRISGAMR